VFQVLCCAALRQVSSITDAQAYGLKGQRQRGIDILARFLGGKLWVAQCKACQPSTARKHVKEAVADFVPHASHWRSRGADRFLIMVGCASDDVKLQDDLPSYEVQLEGLGFKLELWGSDKIQRYLRDDPRGIETILGPEFVPLVCGIGAAVGSPRVVFADGAARITSNLVEELGAAHSAKLDYLRDLALKGKESQAEGELRSLLASEAWRMSSGAHRSRALILLASLTISRRADLEEADRLLAAAKAEDPRGRFVALEAHLRQEREGAAAALGALPEPTDIQEWNTRIALLINSNRIDEAVRQVDAPAFSANAETFRLGALAHLLLGDVETARARVEEAERRAGDHLAVREVAAIIDYCSALSPGFSWEAQRLCLHWPLPVKRAMVRSDDESIEALSRAAARFESIVVGEDVRGPNSRRARIWQLACLANLSGQDETAQKFADGCFADSPGDPWLVLWALERNWKFDRPASISILEASARLAESDCIILQALTSAQLAEGRIEDCARWLDDQQRHFGRADRAQLWRSIRVIVAAELRDDERVEQLLACESEQDLRSRLRAATDLTLHRESQSLNEIATALDVLQARTGRADDLWVACEVKHLVGDFGYVVKNVDRLIQRIGTEAAVRLSIDSAIRVGDPALCLRLLDGNGNLFPGEKLPLDLCRAKAWSLHRLSRLQEARDEMELVARKTDAGMDWLELAYLQLNRGDTDSAAVTASKLLFDQAVSASDLLQLAAGLRVENRPLAKQLFAAAQVRGIESSQMVAFAVKLGFDLGLDDELSGLVQRFAALADEPNSMVQRFELADIIRLSREWQETREQQETAYARGEMPVHLLAQVVNEPLAMLIHAFPASIEAAQIRPDRAWALRIQHGGKRSEPVVRSPSKGIYLDVTSFLLAVHLDYSICWRQTSTGSASRHGFLRLWRRSWTNSLPGNQAGQPVYRRYAISLTPVGYSPQRWMARV
jgi:hypothetical protein